MSDDRNSNDPNPEHDRPTRPLPPGTYRTEPVSDDVEPDFDEEDEPE